jgi:hypothetical protein
MKDLDLKRLWQQQTVAPATQIANTEVALQMKKRMDRFNRGIFWRDAREVGACLALIAWAGYGLACTASALTHAGHVIIILSSAFIAFRLTTTRRKNQAGQCSDPVSDFLVAEGVRIQNQINLLRSVLWWYILPLLSGAILMVLGQEVSSIRKGVVLGVMIPFGWLVHWLNHRAIRTSLLPLKRELARILAAVSTGGSARQELD